MKYAAILFAALITSNTHLFAAQTQPHDKSYAQAVVATTNGCRRSAISVIDPKDQLLAEQRTLETIQITLRKKRNAYLKLERQIDDLTNKESETESRIAKLTQAQAFKQLVELRQKKEFLQTKTQQDLAQLDSQIAQLSVSSPQEAEKPAENPQNTQKPQDVLPQPNNQSGSAIVDPATTQAPSSANKSWLAWPFGS